MAVTLVTKFLAALVLDLVSGWALMLAIGVMHAEVYPPLQPAGYWVALVLVILLRLAFGRGTTDDE